MRIAYTTTFNALNVHEWSGTPYYMAKSFEQVGNEVEYIGSLKQQQ